MKKIISELIEYIDLSDIAGPIRKAIYYFQTLDDICRHKAYTNIQLKEVGSYEDSGLELWGDRYETDAEYKKRLEAEKKKELKRIKNKERSEFRKRLNQLSIDSYKNQSKIKKDLGLPEGIDLTKFKEVLNQTEGI